MLSHGYYRDTGIILSAIPLGESDRIVSVFTVNNGRKRVVAKGVRKTKSRFGGRLNQFSIVDLQLYRGKTFDGISQAELTEHFPTLASDFRQFQAASSMVEAIQRLTEEGERNVRLFTILRDGLRALSLGCAPRQAALAHLTRVGAIQGAHPVLGACAECGSEALAAISLRAGGTVCQLHSAVDDFRYSPEVVDRWRDLLDFSKSFNDISSQEVTQELEALVVGFVSWHFESGFKSFKRIADVH